MQHTRIHQRLLGLAIVVAIGLSACGGASPEDLIEAAGSAGGTTFDEVELDADGTFSAQLGDAEVAFGGEGRPDWLEPQFVLPDELDIQYAINDPSTGERAITGTIAGGDAEAIMAQQASSLTAAGYERIGDTGYFVAPGAMPIEVEVEQEGTLVYFAWQHSFEDEQTLRDAFAPIEGQGSMAVTLDGIRYLFEGPCSLRSNGGQIETDLDLETGQGSATVELRDGSQNYALVNITTVTGDVFGTWTLLQQDEAGNVPTINVDPGGFNITGFMTNFTDGAVAPVVIGVACPG